MNRLTIAAVAVALCALAGSTVSRAATPTPPSGAARYAEPAVHAKQAWTRIGISTGLNRPGQSVVVPYVPPRKQIPAAAVITRVYADRDYAGQADVQTSLCWNGTERCIDLVGRSITTQAFSGLDAGAPVYLVHRVIAWRGSRPPLFVKGNVTVWYETPSETR